MMTSSRAMSEEPEVVAAFGACLCGGCGLRPPRDVRGDGGAQCACDDAMVQHRQRARRWRPGPSLWTHVWTTDWVRGWGLWRTYYI